MTTIFAKTLEKNRIFSHFSPPYNVGFLCDYAVRWGTTKQPNCFPSSLVIIFSDQHCSGGQRAWKKARGEVSSDIFCMVNQMKKQQNDVVLSSCFGKDCRFLYIEYVMGNEAVQVLKLILISFRAFRYSLVQFQIQSLLFTVSSQHLSS